MGNIDFIELRILYITYEVNFSFKSQSFVTIFNYISDEMRNMPSWDDNTYELIHKMCQ